MKSMNIELHIEELVLHGFSPGDRYSIGDAVERELAGMFGDRGLPPSLTRNVVIGRVDGGAFDVASGAKPDRIGGQVAEAVYGGLNR